jgi:hypothetical protein
MTMGRQEDLEKRSEDVFSAERREDLWAIIIALIVVLLSFPFHEQIAHFFKETLILF